MQKSLVQFILVMGLFLLINLTARANSPVIPIVPLPQSIEFQKGEFVFKPEKSAIRIHPQTPQDDRFSAEMLREMLEQHLSLNIPIVTENASETIHLATYPQDPEIQKLCKKRKIVLDEQLGREGYVISIRPGEMIVTSLTSTGLFYAVQTLRQLIRAELTAGNPRLRAMLIRDFPLFDMRAVEIDLNHPPIPTIAQLKSQIRRLAGLKINYVTWYCERGFQPEKYPRFGLPGGAFTRQELKDLVDYAAQYRIEVIGNFQTTGDYDEFLMSTSVELTEQPLARITSDSNAYNRFVIDVLEELQPVFSSRYFQINADFPKHGDWLKLHPNVNIVDAFSLYINRLHQQLTGYDKQLLLWADFALRMPEIVTQLPTDLILCVRSNPNTDSVLQQIQTIQNEGFSVLFSPRDIPHDSAISVIPHLKAMAMQTILKGVLLPIKQNFVLNVPPIQWRYWANGAELGWNPQMQAPNFNYRFLASCYGAGDPEAASVMQWADSLAKCNQRFLPEMMERQAWLWWLTGDAKYNGCSDTLDTNHRIIHQMIDNMMQLEMFNLHSDFALMQQMVRRLELVGNFIPVMLQAGSWYQQAYSVQGHGDSSAIFLRQCWKLLSEQVQGWQNVRSELRQLWLTENRIYGLDHQMKWMDELIRTVKQQQEEVEQAIENDKKGLRLLSPDEIGWRMILDFRMKQMRNSECGMKQMRNSDCGLRN